MGRSAPVGGACRLRRDTAGVGTARCAGRLRSEGRAGAAARRGCARLAHLQAESARFDGDPRRREDGPRAVGAACARAPPGGVADEDHDGADCTAEAPAPRHRAGRQVGAARSARSGGSAHRRAGRGVEAHVCAAPLLRQRRRARPCDRRRRRQVAVRARDERRGEKRLGSAIRTSSRRAVSWTSTTTRARGISPR